MIEIYPDTNVYIAAPAATATGGPELLHQLSFHLRNDLKINAYMYYFPSNYPEPVHPNYKEYENPFVRQIEDNRKNILIVPEIIEGINLTENYPNVRKVIWWLSVDNFYLSYVLHSKTNFLTVRVINKVYKEFTGKVLYDIAEIALKSKMFERLRLPNSVKKSDYHFVQSYYALNYLKVKGINESKIYYLSDYLNMAFLKIQTDLSKKENIVAYNPKKGYVFTQKIISYAKDIKFIPLVNMTREEVIKTLQRAKVYIDFGNHPGKDRIPREAAILGCCVITGKRGSAGFFEDIPIPDAYKFDDKEENIPRIVEKIKDCFENFEERHKDFEYYRNVIRNGPQKFVEDLKQIFIKVEK